MVPILYEKKLGGNPFLISTHPFSIHIQKIASGTTPISKSAGNVREDQRRTSRTRASSSRFLAQENHANVPLRAPPVGADDDGGTTRTHNHVTGIPVCRGAWRGTIEVERAAMVGKPVLIPCGHAVGPAVDGAHPRRPRPGGCGWSSRDLAQWAALRLQQGADFTASDSGFSLLVSSRTPMGVLEFGRIKNLESDARQCTRRELGFEGLSGSGGALAGDTAILQRRSAGHSTASGRARHRSADLTLFRRALYQLSYPTG
jgi:hypothetical protein